MYFITTVNIQDQRPGSLYLAKNWVSHWFF